jgi:hypothetical protein
MRNYLTAISHTLPLQSRQRLPVGKDAKLFVGTTLLISLKAEDIPLCDGTPKPPIHPFGGFLAPFAPRLCRFCPPTTFLRALPVHSP